MLELWFSAQTRLGPTWTCRNFSSFTWVWTRSGSRQSPGVRMLYFHMIHFHCAWRSAALSPDFALQLQECGVLTERYIPTATQIYWSSLCQSALWCSEWLFTNASHDTNVHATLKRLKLTLSYNKWFNIHIDIYILYLFFKFYHGNPGFKTCRGSGLGQVWTGRSGLIFWAWLKLYFIATFQPIVVGTKNKKCHFSSL